MSILDHDARILPEMGAKVDFLEPESASNVGRTGEDGRSGPVRSAEDRRRRERTSGWSARAASTERPVTVGPVSAGFLEVRSGLNGGEQLLVGGVEAPNEGMRVKTQ